MPGDGIWNSWEVYDGYRLARHAEGVSGGLAMLGGTRLCRTPIARRGVFVERHLAGGGRGLRGAQWDLRTVGQPLVTPLGPPLESSFGRWDALQAAVNFRQAACRPPVVGQTAPGPTPQDGTSLTMGPPAGGGAGHGVHDRPRRPGGARVCGALCGCETALPRRGWSPARPGDTYPVGEYRPDSVARREEPAVGRALLAGTYPARSEAVSGSGGAYPCEHWLALPRVVPRALTAYCRWRRTYRPRVR
jgi:hypothetical protein